MHLLERSIYFLLIYLFSSPFQGYNASLMIGSIIQPQWNNHTLVHVRDVVTKGDNFLIDVASGYPTFQALPLDFEVSTEIFLISIH